MDRLVARAPHGPLSVLAALIVLAAPLQAQAKKVVVVLGISGPRGGQATRLITRSLASRYRIVGRGAFVRAARDQGERASSAAGRSAAARALRVAGIIQGSIRRVGRRWVLRIVVYSGHSGRTVGARTFPLRGTRVDPGTARRVPGGIAGAMARARTGAPTRRAAVHVKRRRRVHRPARRRRPTRVASRTPVAPPPAPRGGGFDDGSDLNTAPEESAEPPRAYQDEPRAPVQRSAPPPPRVAAGGRGEPLFEVADGEGEGDAASQDGDGEVPVFKSRGASRDEGDEGEEVAAEVSDSSGKRRSWEKVLELSVGLMAMSRSFEIANPIPESKKYRTYESGMAPAINLEAALYPLVYFNRGPLANLGIVARYYRVLGLKSQIEKVSAEPVDTTLHTFEAGMRYRWNILDSKTSPTLKAGADFGRMGFKIQDDSGTMGVPNVAYVYLKLALVGLEVPFYATSSFLIGGVATFDYLLVFSSGDIEKTDSRGFGRSQTGGIDIGAGLFASYSGFFGKVSGFYRRFFYDFDASCVEFTECNGAGGALDIYLGVSFMAGYAF